MSETVLETGPGRKPRDILVLTFPFWATDCAERDEPSLAGQPLALHLKDKGALRIGAVNPAARKLGLFVGQPLGDARAQVPALATRPFDAPALCSRFRALALWHLRFSPLVGLHPHGGSQAGPDKESKNFHSENSIVVDVTGALHLRGGRRGLLEAALDGPRRQGLAVTGALAPTIGAAWALARFSPGAMVTGDPRPALAPLPVEALRLPPETVSGLKDLGLFTVGRLLGRPRFPLAARFPLLLGRLDQALGAAPEKLEPLLPVPPHALTQTLPEPLTHNAPMLAVARTLAHTLCARLEEERQGALSIVLDLFRVDHRVMTLEVATGRPSRDPAQFLLLLSHRIEALAEEIDAGFGIEAIRLSVPALSPLESAQEDAFSGAQGLQEIGRLHARIASRLGIGAVQRAELGDTHLPEAAVRLSCALAPRAGPPPIGPLPAAPRPPRLLPAPEPVAVIAEVPDGPPARMVWRGRTHRLVRAAGPERIGPPWWREGHGKTRDYYRAEDEEGRRFWLFRDGLFEREKSPRWFLHGFFP